MRPAITAFTFTLTGFVAGAVFFIAASLVLAWTGPSVPPPGSNVSPPVNVGSVAQEKTSLFGAWGIQNTGSLSLMGTNRYLAFNSNIDVTGYGIRDNAGTLEFKNNGGSWSNLTNSVLNVLGTGAVTQIKFSDGTTQTTAQAGSDAGGWCGLATGTLYGSCTNPSYGSPSYSSVATCKGQSVASSCPAGYALQTITMSQIYQICTGACQPQYYCMRTCSKN